jgi:hypothetical protein
MVWVASLLSAAPVDAASGLPMIRAGDRPAFVKGPTAPRGGAI